MFNHLVFRRFTPAILGQTAFGLGCLLVGLLLLGGCVTKKAQVRKVRTSYTMTQQTGDCLRVFDHRMGMRFCVPPRSSFRKLRIPKDRVMGNTMFEVQLAVAETSISVLVRKDRLPTDLPEGALSGPWLKRYAESYAMSRKVAKKPTIRILHPKRSRYLRADAAVWMAFPITQPAPHAWEEVLILARKPTTRYVISVRIGAAERQEKHTVLRQFFVSFLRGLRLHGSTS